MNEEGKKIYEFAKRIFPICRSITGEGVRETLRIISEELCGMVQLNVHEISSGTEVFDWIIPKEWRISKAYIEDERGCRIIDYKDNNLFVLNYSTAVDKWVTLEELKEYVYTQPDQLEVIPYVTSYYKERYGFCMSQKQLDSLPEGKYHMVIDSELFDGRLNYGEVFIQGDSEEEVFFSTYICHPSMANNECSGPALQTALIKYIANAEHRRYSYRFVFVPESIGSLTYMATDNHLKKMQKDIIAGFNLSCVGDDNDYSIIHTRQGNTLADKVLTNVLKFYTQGNYTEYSFLERGSDEKQYNSPLANLPVVCFCRTKFGCYKEYHTSADNMQFVSPEGFQGAYEVMKKVITALEVNRYYRTTVVGEPYLSKWGLYPTVSQKGEHGLADVIREVAGFADGNLDIIDLSDTIEISVDDVVEAVRKLKNKGLLIET